MYLKDKFWDPSPAVHALNIAKQHATDALTLEQKSWVINQMVKALLSCPIIPQTTTLGNGEELTFEIMGENPEYLNLVTSIPEWDKGIPI